MTPKLAAPYAILFIVAADLSVVQTPMFHAAPSRYAPFLPGYGPTRVMLEGHSRPRSPRGANWWSLSRGLASSLSQPPSFFAANSATRRREIPQ